MSERYVTLLGAEQVQSAASTISNAAGEMKRAADQIDDALRRHNQFLDDWITRFEAVVSRLLEGDQ